jgi:glycosyltransferase involved in cell wall biosynthesis
LLNDFALTSKKAANQAAAKWSRGFLNGLRENGVDVIGLSHCPEQYWPMGRMFQGVSGLFVQDYPYRAIAYPNVPLLRDRYLAWQYARQVKQILGCEKVDAFVCYNVIDLYSRHALRAARQTGVPCFPIILDGDDPRKDQWRWLLNGTRDADGVVFLSDWMVKNYPGNLPAMHLDGGCSAWHGDEALAKAESKLVVYSGGLDRWRGLEFLAAVVGLIKTSDCRIVICGKCDRDAIRRKMGCDPRVDVKGFVSAEELHDICMRATVFLNTRDPNNGDNILNFPSKIPNYLAYGKPVVSTWLPSMSEEYRKYVLAVDSDDPGVFARHIDDVLSWGSQQLNNNMQLIRQWLMENKLWNIQAAHLIEWMEGVVKTAMC